MRICLDIQSAVTQQAGVGRYTRLLAQHLASSTQSESLRFFYFDFKRKGVPFPSGNAELRSVTWCPGRLAQLAWKTFEFPPFEVFAGRADLYHFPNFILPPLRRGKTVVTIHDMSFARFPEFTEAGNLRHLNARLRHTVARADAIITDSAFSADEIEDLLKVDRSRLFPIHLGVEAGFKRPAADAIAALRKRHALDRPYLLCVGTVEPRKNYPFLVDVFEALRDFEGDLVIAGMPGWRMQPILERFTRSPRAGSIKWLRYVDDTELPALYAGAELLVFPSFYEGFGFPPLEAMACGTPVVSSTGGSLAEVLGDGALMLDHFDVDDWCAGIRRALGDSPLRSRLIESGRACAARYTWAETARQTWDVYRQTIG